MILDPKMAQGRSLFLLICCRSILLENGLGVFSDAFGRTC